MRNETQATANTLARLLQNQKDIDAGKDLQTCKLTIDNCNAINNTVKNAIRLELLREANNKTINKTTKEIK